MPRENIVQLSDDELVAVMQYLGVPDVLACRLVCKRLGSVALHPDVWRHRRISREGRSPISLGVNSAQQPYVDVVLRLAPCLREVVSEPTPTLVATRCAIENLTLEGPRDWPNAEYEYAAACDLAIRNQVALGRLRHIELTIFLMGVSAAAEALLKTVLLCPGLESLVEGSGRTFIEDFEPNTLPVRSSLKRLDCWTNSCFVNTVLAGHAATLEDVCIEDKPDDILSPVSAHLLASMPQLRKLRCSDMLGGLEVVAACQSLREVHIMQDGDTDDDVYNMVVKARIAEFLRRGTQLRTIRLAMCADLVDDVLLLEALASSGRSSVDHLILEGFQDVQPLIPVLPSLHALRHLEMFGAPLTDKFLLSITPASAPALQRLGLKASGPLYWGMQCIHGWIHSDTVKTVLRVNPLLHLDVKRLRGACCSGNPACTSGGCHSEVDWSNVRHLCLSSHDFEKCTTPEYHINYSKESDIGSNLGSQGTWLTIEC